MAGAHDDRTAEPGPPQEDVSSPDWTIWLRSRLERVATSERQSADAGSFEDEAAASDEEGPEGPQGEEATGESITAQGAASTAGRRQSEPFLPRPEPRPDDSELALRLDWPEHPLQQALTAESLRGPRPADAVPAPPLPPADPAPPPPSPVAAEAVPPAPDPPTPDGLDPRPEAVTVPSGGPASALSGPDPAILAGLDSLRAAVTALPSGPDPAILAGLDSLRASVSALSSRIDAVADATGSFRSVMNERLDEYVETVLRAAKGTASDLEDYRRMHASSITELRRATIDTAEALRRLTGWMEELATVQGDDERWAHAMSRVFEEMAVERRAQEDHLARSLSTLSSFPERLDHVEDGLQQVLAELADTRLAPEAPPQPRLELDEVQLKAIALAVADVMADVVTDAMAAADVDAAATSLPPGPPAPAPPTRAKKAAAKAKSERTGSTSKARSSKATPAKAAPAKASAAKATPARATPARATSAARANARPRRTTPIQARSPSESRTRS